LDIVFAKISKNLIRLKLGMSVRVMETQISEIEKKEVYDKQVSIRLLKSPKNRYRLLSSLEFHTTTKAESSLPKGSTDHALLPKS
jgi:hypothetical protein